jgi:hypothetical protein
MRSTSSFPLPRLDTTRSRWIRHVPGFASLASLASSVPHDSCNAMQSGAVCCNPEDAAMTQPVTQAQAPGGRNDASDLAGCLANTSHTFAHVAFVASLGNQRPTIAPCPTWANVAFVLATPADGS